MLKILIKNYLKLIFRDCSSLVIGILCPIFLISMTSICLTQSLPGAIKIEGTYLGYSMSKENSHFRALLKDLEAQDIQLKEVEDRQQGIDGVAKGELAGYIEWSTNNYALYLPGGK